CKGERDMFVRSTGLGKTPMVANVKMLQFAKINKESLKDDPSCELNMVMRIETTKPAAWHITAFMSPEDVRDLAKKILTPSTLIQVLSYMFSSSSSDGKAKATVSEQQGN
ncbi:MAG: hypothetical protein ABSF74_10550, partial [Dehalococcoidia bacterium]